MTDDTGLVPDPARIADTLAVQEVLSMHSRGLDRLDQAALQACYWPGAEVDFNRVVTGESSSSSGGSCSPGTSRSERSS